MTACLLVGSRGRLAAVLIGSVGACRCWVMLTAGRSRWGLIAGDVPADDDVGPPESGPVIYVSDNDTPEVREGAGTARVLGINAPEIARDGKPAQ